MTTNYTISNEHDATVYWGNRGIPAGESYTLASDDTLAGIGIIGDIEESLITSGSIKLNPLTMTVDGVAADVDETLSFLSNCHENACRGYNPVYCY